MKYGKIIEGVLNLAPKRIVLDEMQIFNPTAEQLIQAGYKEIHYTDYPSNPAPAGQHYKVSYEDKGEYIEQVWELVNTPETVAKKTLEDRMSTLEQTMANFQNAIERGISV